MTQPTTDARTAVYHELMWPERNPRSEAYGTSRKQAEQLLANYAAEVRAAVLREAADELEKPFGETWASRQLRYMAKKDHS